MPPVENYRQDLKAHVTVDSFGRTCAIRHTQEYWATTENAPVAAALEYLNDMSGEYSALPGRLARAHVPVRYDQPVREQGLEYRLSHDKQHFGATTVGFYQTYMNVPVWRSGLAVTVKPGPNRVIGSVDTSHPDFEIEGFDDTAVSGFNKLAMAAELAHAQRRVVGKRAKADDKAGAGWVRKALDKAAFGAAHDTVSKGRPSFGPTRVIQVRLWVYRYDAANRFPADHGGEDGPGVPMLPVGPVDKRIEDGKHYFVAEMIFSLQSQHFPWRALVELETGSVLLLRPFIDGVEGKVFQQDPISSTGDSTNTYDQPNATLNPLRHTVTLENLDTPATGADQELTGTLAALSEEAGPNIAPPTEPTGTDFFYDVRTNEFAAVSTYYHVDRFFRTLEDLGFPLATYFDATTFPVEADHRGEGGVSNAHCIGTGTGGIDYVTYGVMDSSGPLGRACDPRVHWHELGGHGVLYEHVNSANFGFAHSAGDGVSGIFHDPTSSAPGSQRFEYTPWHQSLRRYLNRDPAAGWAWGGSRDDTGYGSEEILGTCHFRMYRAIGGDSPHESRQLFASRMSLYLIFRAIQSLTPATNPDYARGFSQALMTVDALDWTSEGVFGGAYHKVIRWCFEQQGEYQIPLLETTDPDFGTITAPGEPPPADVYIDDGRAGGYDHQNYHWGTTTIWNRNADDGGTGHDVPLLDQPNYMYVKIRNRGTEDATNVVVRGFHSMPGAGLSWPDDFEAFTTAQIDVGTILADDVEEVTVGPFEWTPNLNSLAHDCTLMVVSCDGDAANVDNFTPGEHIALWRLVGNDNNIGQRNVYPVPGGGGEQALMAALDGAKFWVGNPDPRPAKIEFEVELPDVLKRAGWRLNLNPGNGLMLKPGEKQAITISLKAGASFTADQVRASVAKDIEVVVLGNGGIIGGMTYPVDPDIRHAANPTTGRPDGGDGKRCAPAASKLLECLGVSGADVGCAQIEKITVGIKLKNDDCC